MSAGTYDLTIEQGAALSFDVTIRVAGKDFSAYNVRAKIVTSFGGSRSRPLPLRIWLTRPSVRSASHLDLTPAPRVV